MPSATMLPTCTMAESVWRETGALHLLLRNRLLRNTAVQCSMVPTCEVSKLPMLPMQGPTCPAEYAKPRERDLLLAGTQLQQSAGGQSASLGPTEGLDDYKHTARS